MGARVFALAASVCLGFAIAGSASARQVSARETAASLAYIVAQHSPLLSAAQRREFSQDFNGAPLAGAPRVHNVAAARVWCRARQPSLGDETRCTVTYGANQSADIGGAEAKSLFDALGAVGVEGEAGMGHVERAITALACTVDDRTAQQTPSTGNMVAGFACRFVVDD